MGSIRIFTDGFMILFSIVTVSNHAAILNVIGIVILIIIIIRI